MPCNHNCYCSQDLWPSVFHRLTVDRTNFEILTVDCNLWLLWCISRASYAVSYKMALVAAGGNEFYSTKGCTVWIKLYDEFSGSFMHVWLVWSTVRIALSQGPSPPKERPGTHCLHMWRNIQIAYTYRTLLIYANCACWFHLNKELRLQAIHYLLMLYRAPFLL